VAGLLQCRIDPELDRAIDDFAAKHQLTRAQAARELLRQAALDVQPVDRGWREGFFSGWGDGKATWMRSLRERSE